MPGNQTEAGQAFAELLAALGDIGQHLLVGDGTVGGNAEAAAGYRFLGHLLSASFELDVDGDPERPLFTRIVTPTRKFLGDNPDAIYYWTRIRGDRGYRIPGNV